MQIPPVAPVAAIPKNKTAVHHQGWGHCKNCNTWSYFLSEQKSICPLCDKKLKEQNHG